MLEGWLSLSSQPGFQVQHDELHPSDQTSLTNTPSPSVAYLAGGVKINTTNNLNIALIVQSCDYKALALPTLNIFLKVLKYKSEKMWFGQEREGKRGQNMAKEIAKDMGKAQSMGL